MRRLPLCLLACCLLALPALAACNRQSSSSREAEVAELRQKVERLEREAAEDRQRLAADLDALHASLDEANRLLAGQQSAQNATAATPGKSPRAALRESLRGVMEMSRQALDRLNQGLDKSLSRPKPAPEAPAQTPETPR